MKTEQMKIKATIEDRVFSEWKDSANIWTRVSPNSAPQAREKRNLMMISNDVTEQNFFKTKTMIAAKNPINDTDSPPKKPKPQICCSVR